MAWLAKSISGWGQTPKSTVTPVHSAMATPPSTGTGAAGGVPPSSVGLLVGQQDLLVERGHGARHRPRCGPFGSFRRAVRDHGGGLDRAAAHHAATRTQRSRTLPSRPSASPSPPLAYISTATRR